MTPTTLIFDIDGTLIDPWVGVIRSAAYALETLGAEAPKFDEMRWFIGPPLRENFIELLKTDNPALIDEALRLYRERFGKEGIAECILYDGIPELLRDLSKQYTLFVATARIQWLTEAILKYFNLDGYFAAAYGTQQNGEFNDKADLLRHISSVHAIDPLATTMIGDRRHDIIAAKANGLKSIGVTYGYGSKEELDLAGADTILPDVAGLRRFLLESTTPG